MNLFTSRFLQRQEPQRGEGDLKDRKAIGHIQEKFRWLCRANNPHGLDLHAVSCPKQSSGKHRVSHNDGYAAWGWNFTSASLMLPLRQPESSLYDGS